MARGWIDVPVKALQAAPWNYKRKDEQLQAKLSANIKKNGQIETVIVRETAKGQFEVVNGNHRLDAFVELGTPTIHAFNLGKVSDAQAKRIAIETNETRFKTDRIGLARLTKELLDEFSVQELEETMPFSADEIDGLVEMLKFDWSEIGEAVKSQKALKGENSVAKIVISVPLEQHESVLAKVAKAVEGIENVKITKAGR